MSRALWIGGAVAGGLSLLGGGYLGALVVTGNTGLPNLDALHLRVAFELLRHGLFMPKHMRAMMAILHNEQSNGHPDSDIFAVPRVGDLDARVGPSIGNGQVSRGLAIRLGLWPSTGPGQLDDDQDRAAYQAFGEDPGNFGELLGWSVVAYKATLEGAGGDVWGEGGAVRLYNGPGDAALDYRANAIAFVQSKFPSEVLS